MPDLALLERPTATSSDDADIAHLVCCDDDTALCGADVSEMGWTEDGIECGECVLEWELGDPCPQASCQRREGP